MLKKLNQWLEEHTDTYIHTNWSREYYGYNGQFSLRWLNAVRHIRGEIALRRKPYAVGASITIHPPFEGDQDISLCLQAGFVSLYLSAESFLPAPLLKFITKVRGKKPCFKQDAKSTGITLFFAEDMFLNIVMEILHVDSFGSYPRNVWQEGWNKRVDLPARLLGEMEGTDEGTVEHKAEPIEFPEGIYFVDVEISTTRWKRKRSPFSTVKHYACYNIEQGIENGHHKGPLFGLSIALEGDDLKLSSAKAAFVKLILEERIKYTHTYKADYRPPRVSPEMLDEIAGRISGFEGDFPNSAQS